MSYNPCHNYPSRAQGGGTPWRPNCCTQFLQNSWCRLTCGVMNTQAKGPPTQPGDTEAAGPPGLPVSCPGWGKPQQPNPRLGMSFQRYQQHLLLLLQTDLRRGCSASRNPPSKNGLLEYPWLFPCQYFQWQRLCQLAFVFFPLFSTSSVIRDWVFRSDSLRLSNFAVSISLNMTIRKEIYIYIHTYKKALW